jgi:hypothetical protein
MNNQDGNAEYSIWNEKSIISDCFRKLGYAKLADQVHKNDMSGDIMESYIKLLANTARATKRHDVLEVLCYSGLIYG